MQLDGKLASNLKIKNMFGVCGVLGYDAMYVFLVVFQMWTSASPLHANTTPPVTMESIRTHVNAFKDSTAKTAKQVGFSGLC